MSTTKASTNARSGHARRSEETQQRLLDAAISVIATSGWHGLSNRAVAQRAGVNLALIRYHFTDQAGLMDAALHEAVARLDLPALDPPPEGLPALLRALITQLPTSATHEAARVVLAASTAAIFDPALARRVGALLQGFRAQLAACDTTDDETIASGRATLAAALLDGLMLHLLVDPDTDLEAAAAALTACSP